MSVEQAADGLRAGMGIRENTWLALLDTVFLPGTKALAAMS